MECSGLTTTGGVAAGARWAVGQSILGALETNKSREKQYSARTVGIVYQFPTITLTNDHNFSGPQCTNVILHCWRREAWHRSHGATVKALQSKLLSMAPGGSISWHFPAPRCCCIPWLMACSSIFTASDGLQSPFQVYSDLPLQKPSLLSLFVPLPLFLLLMITVSPPGKPG